MCSAAIAALAGKGEQDPATGERGRR